jgi:hypothetical protein
VTSDEACFRLKAMEKPMAEEREAAVVRGHVVAEGELAGGVGGERQGALGGGAAVGAAQGVFDGDGLVVRIREGDVAAELAAVHETGHGAGGGEDGRVDAVVRAAVGAAVLALGEDVRGGGEVTGRADLELAEPGGGVAARELRRGDGVVEKNGGAGGEADGAGGGRCRRGR